MKLSCINSIPVVCVCTNSKARIQFFSNGGGWNTDNSIPLDTVIFRSFLLLQILSSGRTTLWTNVSYPPLVQWRQDLPWIVASNSSTVGCLLSEFSWTWLNWCQFWCLIRNSYFCLSLCFALAYGSIILLWFVFSSSWKNNYNNHIHGGSDSEILHRVHMYCFTLLCFFMSKMSQKTPGAQQGFCPHWFKYPIAGRFMRRETCPCEYFFIWEMFLVYVLHAILVVPIKTQHLTHTDHDHVCLPQHGSNRFWSVSLSLGLYSLGPVFVFSV